MMSFDQKYKMILYEASLPTLWYLVSRLITKQMSGAPPRPNYYGGVQLFGFNSLGSCNTPLTGARQCCLCCISCNRLGDFSPDC